MATQAVACLAVVWLAAACPAEFRTATDLGVVGATPLSPEVIAVPAFGAQPTAGSAAMAETIYRNLEISGYFKRPANAAFVEETHRKDQQAGAINFDEWRRLRVRFLVKAQASVVQGVFAGQLQVFETGKGSRVFAMEYTKFSSQTALAQRMADDIMLRLTGQKGLASTKIAYVGILGNGVKEIFVMDADGGAKRQLTRDGTLALAPCWGMNGKEIYFTTFKDRNPDLCGMFADGSQSWWISRRPSLNISPNWSQASQRIVLTLGKDGNSEIYSMDRAGSMASLKRLTFEREIDSSPCWSPNGKQVCFTSGRGGSPQLYIMDAEGIGPRRLTLSGSYNDGAAWRPHSSDGVDRIAFAGRVEGVFDIYTIRPDGSGLQRLTQGQGNNEEPCWSPDGAHIAFTSNRTGQPQIWVMNDDGSNQQRLTTGSGAQSPAWGPFPQ